MENWFVDKNKIKEQMENAIMIELEPLVDDMT